MEDSASSFPLFNLPNGPLKCVLQNMGLIPIFGFSILSKRCKDLVKSLNLKDHEVYVIISRRDVSIKVMDPEFPELYLLFDMKPLRMDNGKKIKSSTTKLYTPDHLCLDEYEELDGIQYKRYTYEFKKPGFEIEDWIAHFLSILNRPKLDQLSFLGSTLDVECVHNSIRDVAEIQILDCEPVTRMQKIAQTYSSAKKLKLCFYNIRVLESFHNLLCQCFDDLKLLSMYYLPEWKMDDLLLINSRNIDIFNSNLTDKELNRFLKHWINGSNRRMERMRVELSDDVLANKEILLNGLNYQIVPSDHEKMLKSSWYDSFTKNGYDIQRKDGTKATIIVCEDQEDEFFEMELVVWHSYL